jgi:large subunit ribosomal protein L3
MEFIVEKIGMSRLVGEKSIPVTLLKIIPAKVCELKDNGKALVAYPRGKKLNKPIEGMQKKYNLPKEFNRFVELKVANNEPGDLSLEPLKDAKKVKLTFKSKGRGFQGVVKRHGFAGGPGAHGSRFHRAPGSIGNCEFPGRVMPGKKMPGHYGNENVTVNAEVVEFNEDMGVLVIKGSVPGSNGSLGKVRIVK